MFKNFIGKFFRILLWGCVLVIICAGLFAFQPLIMADDNNTMRRLNFGVEHMTGMEGHYTIHMVRSYSGDVEKPYDLSGTFAMVKDQGIRMSNSSVLKDYDSDLDISVDTVSNEDVFLDLTNGNLYVGQDDLWHVYSNGRLVIDPSWWMHQINDSVFSYAGQFDMGSLFKAIVVEHTYSGSDAVDFFNQLHFKFDGVVDMENSDVRVAVYMHPLTGRPLKFTMTSAETGYPISVSEYSGESYRITELHGEFEVDGYEPEIDLSAPTNISNDEPVSVSSDMIVAENDYTEDPDVVKVVEKIPGGIISPDRRWNVGFDSNGTFDKVSVVENSRIQATSSQTLTGQPEIEIYYRDKLDAYSAAKSDAKTALQYYNDTEGLSEAYVDVTMLQSMIDGHVAYMYLSQFTDDQYDYVASYYCVYIELTPTQYVRMVVSSLVDPGINPVLSDEYVKRILDHIWIQDLNG